MQLAPVTATYCVEALVLSQVALSHGTALQSRSAGLEAENRSAGDLIGLGPRGIVYRAENVKDSFRNATTACPRQRTVFVSERIQLNEAAPLHCCYDRALWALHRQVSRANKGI